jgi:hypothetical protein
MKRNPLHEVGRAGRGDTTIHISLSSLRNLDCTHYPEPQTGVAYTSSAGEC